MSSGVLARAVVVLEGDDSKLEAVMSNAEKKMKHLGERMTEIGETMTHKVTLPILAAGALAVHAFGEQEDAMARVTGIVESTGGAAGVTAEHIKKLAESLEETTTFADQTTEAAAAVVLSFTNIRNEAGKGNDIFDRTIKVGQDLSELMGKDLQGAFAALGKTMEDPEQGMMLLRRANVILSESVKQQIKDLLDHGRVLEAQKLVLDQVEKATGGLAEKMAKTPLGQMKQAWNEVDNALEDAGNQLAHIIVLPVTDKVKGWAHEFRQLNDDTKRTVVLIGMIAAAIGPLLVGIGTIIKVGSLLSVALSGVANLIGPLIVSFRLAAGSATAFTVGTTSILAPVALAIAALLALSAAIVAVGENWTWVKIQIASFITMLLDKFVTAVDFILGILSHLPMGAGKVFEDLRQELSDAWENILADTGKTLSELQNELDGVDGAVTKTANKINKRAPRTPPWLAAVNTALTELRTSMEVIAEKQAVLGTSFNAAGAKADAYAGAVDAVAKSHVGLDVVLDKTGTTLRGLMQKMQATQAQAALVDLQLALEEAGKKANALGQKFDLATEREQAFSAVVSTLTGLHVKLDTVLDKTGTTLRSLIQDWRAAQIATAVEQFANAMRAASMMSEVLGGNFDKTGAQVQAYSALIQAAIAAHKELTDKIEGTGMTLGELIQKMQDLSELAQLQAKLRSIFTDLSDFLVDWAFGAKKSFSEFVREVLMDLTKLILKMMILRELKDIFNPTKEGILGSIGKVLGFAQGGFLGPSEIGLVGERGPEFITGGRSGVTVTPLPAMAAAGGGGSIGPSVAVHLTVTAIDSKGVEQFVDENEGLFANAMLRAYSKSSMMRRKLGGR